MTDVGCVLEAQQASIAEQLAELRELRGRNQDVVQHMLDRGTTEKELFERAMQRFTALRTVFTQQTSALFDIIGLEAAPKSTTCTPPKASRLRARACRSERSMASSRCLREAPWSQAR